MWPKSNVINTGGIYEFCNNELARVIGGKRYKVYLRNTLVGIANSFSDVAVIFLF